MAIFYVPSISCWNRVDNRKYGRKCVNTHTENSKGNADLWSEKETNIKDPQKREQEIEIEKNHIGRLKETTYTHGRIPWFDHQDHTTHKHTQKYTNTQINIHLSTHRILSSNNLEFFVVANDVSRPFIQRLLWFLFLAKSNFSIYIVVDRLIEFDYAKSYLPHEQFGGYDPCVIEKDEEQQIDRTINSNVSDPKKKIKMEIMRWNFYWIALTHTYSHINSYEH